MYFDDFKIMDGTPDRERRRQLNGLSNGSHTPVPPHIMAMKPFFSGQPKSLSGIALRAFCLGIALCASIIGTISVLLLTDSPIWRVPFFLGCLSTFHFLEFWTTAERNTLVASIDSFLLMSNGLMYALAHTMAFLECTIVCVFFPNRSWALSLSPILLALGIALVIIGQIVRSWAMLAAGVSFNHHVQTHRADSHILVTSGIYSVFRHPSYFGFFWWGLGTQLVLGNAVCFVGYAAVLWRFFSGRIQVEEANLVHFFGKDYEDYRARVSTKIPFIR